MGAQRGQHGVGGIGRDDGDQLAFVGDVQRVQPQQFAGGVDLRLHGDRASSSSMPTPTGARSR
jgi:hypothetical protein